MRSEKFYEKDWFITVLFAISGGIVLGGFFLAWIDWNGGHGEWDNPGIRGDFWGGHIGAVANLAAFIILVAATLLQRKELIESRIINKQIADESANQANALKQQIEISRSSQSHTNFFQLIQFLDNSERAVLAEDDRHSVVGRFFVRQCAEKISRTHADQTAFRLKFYEMAQFFSWIEIIWGTIDNTDSIRDREYFQSVFFAKFNESYLKDIKTIMDYYNMPGFNLQTIAPRLYERLLHRFGERRR